MTFVLATSTLGAINNNLSLKENGCAQYAIDAADAEAAHYGNMTVDEWRSTAQDYWRECNRAGGAGNMLEPVFT